MAGIDFTAVPDDQRDEVTRAVTDAFGSGPGAGVEVVRPVPGGASGALTFRIDGSAGAHLLRIERLQGAMRNPHQYECMAIAAEAGIAPPIRHLDEGAGVVVLPFLDQQPLESYPGGPPALLSAVAELLARLHATTPFPVRGDHLADLGRLLGGLEASGRVAPGLLARHVEGLERIRAAYPWDPSSFVSAHNDPNQFNLLYDGKRLWLIDWETARRNDPMIDLATVASYVAPTAEARTALLRAWSGAEPTPVLEARLEVMGLLVRLFAGSILLLIVPDPTSPVHTDLDALSLGDFGRAIAEGRLVPGTPAATLGFARTMLRSFVEGMASPETDRALQVLAAGVS